MDVVVVVDVQTPELLHTWHDRSRIAGGRAEEGGSAGAPDAVPGRFRTP